MFIGDDDIYTCSLLGSLTHFCISRQSSSSAGEQPSITKAWACNVREIAKANAIAATLDLLVVGGMSKDGKGVIELWDVATTT